MPHVGTESPSDGVCNSGARRNDRYPPNASNAIGAVRSMDLDSLCVDAVDLVGNALLEATEISKLTAHIYSTGVETAFSTKRDTLSIGMATNHSNATIHELSKT